MRRLAIILVIAAGLGLAGCTTKRGVPRPLRPFQFIYGRFL